MFLYLVSVTTVYKLKILKNVSVPGYIHTSKRLDYFKQMVQGKNCCALFNEQESTESVFINYCLNCI